MLKTMKSAVREIFLNKHLQTICVWKVIVPFFLIIIIYPIFLFIVKDVHYPFQRSFAHGELLIFSALLLIEAAVELGRAELGYDELLRAVALFVILLYGFMKFQTMTQEPKLERQDIDAVNQLFAFSFFNCTVALCAVAGSLYSFLLAVRGENNKAAHRLEHPSDPT
jgi:hypothetical protein